MRKSSGQTAAKRTVRPSHSMAVLVSGPAAEIAALEKYVASRRVKLLKMFKLAGTAGVSAKEQRELARAIEQGGIFDLLSTNTTVVAKPSVDADSGEADEIVRRVVAWAGSRKAAEAWYRSQSIAALGDQTAEALVRTGQGKLVRRYLDAIAAGGYA